jgi:hypothetical protein
LRERRGPAGVTPPPANDRDCMYTGPPIEPAGGQEPAICCRSRQAAFGQTRGNPLIEIWPSTTAHTLTMVTRIDEPLSRLDSWTP